MFDPQLGQFLSEDPLGFDAADANLRRYVGNSPSNARDPSGLADASPENPMPTLGPWAPGEYGPQPLPKAIPEPALPITGHGMMPTKGGEVRYINPAIGSVVVRAYINNKADGNRGPDGPGLSNTPADLPARVNLPEEVVYLSPGVRKLTAKEKASLTVIFNSLFDDKDARKMFSEALNDALLCDIGQMSYFVAPVEYIAAPAAFAYSSIHAITLGDEVYFNFGQFPEPGKRLDFVGHEVLHVLQKKRTGMGQYPFIGAYLLDALVKWSYRDIRYEQYAYAFERTIKELGKDREVMRKIENGVIDDSIRQQIRDLFKAFLIDEIKKID